MVAAAEQTAEDRAAEDMAEKTAAGALAAAYHTEAAWVHIAAAVGRIVAVGDTSLDCQAPERWSVFATTNASAFPERMSWQPFSRDRGMRSRPKEAAADPQCPTRR